MRSHLTASLASLALASAVAGVFVYTGSPGIAQNDQAEAADIPYVLPESGPFHPEDIGIENDEAITDWYRSAHADQAAEAFRHWDEDEEIRPASPTGPSRPAAWSIAAPATMQGSRR